MKIHRFALDKLIRDKVADNFAKKGITGKYVQLKDNDDYLDALTQKVIEELQEVFSSETQEELVKELADLDDVLETFKKFIGVEQKELDQLRKEKIARNGGFEKRTFCEYIDVPENTEEYEYFSAQDDRFPEMELDDEDSENE